VSLPDCPYRKRLGARLPEWKGHPCSATECVYSASLPLLRELRPGQAAMSQICECILARELCPEGWR